MSRAGMLLGVAGLLSGCTAPPQSHASDVRLDSIELVARAFAASDSARGTHDTLQRAVRGFVRNGSSVIISLGPVSPAVQGGSADVHLDSTGRVLAVRLHQ